MLIALISDVHANLPALQQVMADMEKAVPRDYSGQHIERIWFLGDLIDRGPHPIESVQQFQQLEQQMDVRYIVGNHEALHLGTERMEGVNEIVQLSTQLHKETLTEYQEWFIDRFTTQENSIEGVGHTHWFSRDVDSNRELRVLKMRAQDLHPNIHIFLTHASWFDNVQFNNGYRFPYSFWETREPTKHFANLEAIQRHVTYLDEYARRSQVPVILFYGHSHFVGGVYGDNNGIAHEFPLPPKQKISLYHRVYDINVGSVGHTRIGSPAETRYFLLDTNALTLEHRVAYFNPGLLRNGLNRFYAGYGSVLEHMLQYFLAPER